MNHRALSYGKRHEHKNCLSYGKYETRKTHGKNTQFALPEEVESFPNIHILSTGCGVPQPLLGATNARDKELREIAAIRDFTLCINQNIITLSSHSQLVQIGMKTTNIGIEDPNAPIRTWSWICRYIASNNQQQTQPTGKIKKIILG